MLCMRMDLGEREVPEDEAQARTKLLLNALDYRRGLVTYYTVCAIDVASRRVQVLGSTPHPEDSATGRCWCETVFRSYR